MSKLTALVNLIVGARRRFACPIGQSSTGAISAPWRQSLFQVVGAGGLVVGSAADHPMQVGA